MSTQINGIKAKRAARTPATWRDSTEGPALTISGACRRYKLGHTKLYELINSGEIGSFKVGRGRRVVTASGDDWMQRQIETDEA